MLMSTPVELTPVDRRIGEEELADFVPNTVFDVHTHIYRWAFNTDPDKETGPMKPTTGSEFAEAGWDFFQEVEAVLFPGREVHRLSFPFPFPQCDFEASNDFVIRETRKDP